MDITQTLANPAPANHAPTSRAKIGLVVPDPAQRRWLSRLLAQWSVADVDIMLPADIPARASSPGVPLLVLADDPRLAAGPPIAGPNIAGVLPREAGIGQIVAALAAVAAGLDVSPRRARPSLGLSGRERQIVALAGDGLTNKLIARRLGIAPCTVKYHRETVFARLGVRTRAEAVARLLASAPAQRGAVPLTSQQPMPATTNPPSAGAVSRSPRAIQVSSAVVPGTR
jgi:DNA-binding CsgD family transcriptional regulator